MGALRAAIVDAVCRTLAVKDRGFAKRSGNIVDVLIDAGCDPRVVLKQAAAAAGVSVVTSRLLARTPPPWPDGVDVMKCLARGVVFVAKGKGEWCFAYIDPEDAADHEVVAVSLDLPAHRPVLGLRAQLLPFIQAADPFQASPTQVLPTPPTRGRDDVDGIERIEAVEEVDEVDSDDDDTFNPSMADGAPIDEPANDPLGGNTVSDTNDDDVPHNSAYDTLPAKQKAKAQLAPFADRPDDAVVARADVTNDDDDGFFVDDTERLSQATGLKRPPSKLHRQEPAPTPRDTDTQPLQAPTLSAPSLSKPTTAPKPTKPTKPTKPSKAAATPAWNTPPPRVRAFPQQAVLVTLAVVVVIAGIGAAWRFGLLQDGAHNDVPVVVTDGHVDVGPAQRALLEEAARTPSAQQRERLLSKAIAFDPASADGLRALQARAAVYVVLERKGAALRDLETLKRGLAAHKDVVDAATLTALNNSIVSMRDAP